MRCETRSGSCALLGAWRCASGPPGLQCHIHVSDPSSHRLFAAATLEWRPLLLLRELQTTAQVQLMELLDKISKPSAQQQMDKDMAR